MAQAAPRQQESRDKILDCAEPLFARRGFAGIGLAEVAEQAGLSKSSLFHHFASKAQLYAAVMARILDRIEADLVRALADGGSPVQRLERWLDVVNDVLAAHPTYARLLLRSLFEDDELNGALPEEQAVNATIERIIAAIDRLLREGIEAGVFRPVNVPHTVHSIIGMIVFHFASGELGEELLGSDPFSTSEVRRRKTEVKNLLRHGLVVPTLKVAPSH
ncbi:MAG TPA: TetR/AcrR family transcriptional regulator [Candidatus Limnocylindrales bacterium]|nr:TetR/AcrR family transcriptional regulator [Candidatus Limnocylindrales bacterium]